MRTPYQPSAVCAAYAAIPNIDDDARYDVAEIAISLKSFGAATKS